MKIKPELKQAIINAIRKTYEQGEQSSDHLGECRYRGENGLCCVVGHMIDDEFYENGFDTFGGVSAGHTTVIAAIEKTAGLPPNSITRDEALFLCSLQQCHDLAGEGGTTFREKLKSLVHSLATYEEQPWLMDAFEATK